MGRVRQALAVLAVAVLSGACASAPPEGSEVPVLGEVGTESVPLELQAAVAVPSPPVPIRS